MKLYACWNTNRGVKDMHPCGRVYHQLVEAGFEPDVVFVKGSRMLPRFISDPPGRREVEQLTGSRTVPVLVTDDGEVLAGSAAISEWVRAHHVASTNT